MNYVACMGFAVRDPVMKTGRKSGKEFCLFRLGLKGDYRGPNIERTIAFVDFIAYGKRGQSIHRYLHKGQRICVIGELVTYKSQDRLGNYTTRTCVNVKSFDYIDTMRTKDPIRDLQDEFGEPLIPKEMTDSLIRQIDYGDEDLPDELLNGELNDLLND